MLHFRKKIFIGDGIVFLVVLAILYPIIDQPLDLLFIGLVFAFYISINQLIIRRFTRPILLINDAVRAYQEGKEESLPRIVLPRKHQGDEFSKLAFTLNSLSARIQSQIENLIRQREETKSILESIGEGIVATDTSAKVTFVNRAACRMLGTSEANILRLPLDDIKTTQRDLFHKCHEMILHALQTSEPMIQTWTVRNGSSLHLNIISAPLMHQDGALLVLQDVTSDYKVIEMGKDFIANASHELRTPITIIRGFAETLQDLPDLSQEMLHDITEKIVRTCGRLDKLVRSLLTLADIENLSPDRLNGANLVLLAENCKHHLLAAHPGVHLVLQSKFEMVPIDADTDLLELAILNLLENSVKYSQGVPHIEMSIEQMGSEVELRVQDQGIGISEADLPHIFERFYTVDKARSRKSGGAGLGLSIVKTIVEKHNGRVSVSSQLGKGSTFTLILPLKNS